jgi:hypothetical protein
LNFKFNSDLIKNSGELSFNDGVVCDLSPLNVTQLTSSSRVSSLRQRKVSFNLPLNATVIVDLSKMQLNFTLAIPNRKININKLNI